MAVSMKILGWFGGGGGVGWGGVGRGVVGKSVAIQNIEFNYTSIVLGRDVFEDKRCE